jgi:succinoglycan biosynthesis protein ExoL
MGEIKVLYVLPVIGHPRDSKRIAMLIDQGFHVEAVAFNRVYHNGREPNCNVVSIGKINHKEYLSRIYTFVKSISIVRYWVKKNDIIYASGPDMAYLALVASVGLKRQVILEVGDIQNIQFANNLSGRIVRLLEKIFVKKCSLIVSTSYGFIEKYYHQMLKIKVQYLIIENKLEDSNNGKNSKMKFFSNTNFPSKTLLRIGYFGLFRCDWSWEVLKNIAKQNRRNVKIVIAGYSLSSNKIAKESARLKNIEYLGNYKSPEDLASLYDQVDIVWATYPKPLHDDYLNWRLARTNRFYESLFFYKPIIVLDGSGDYQDTINYKIGLIISQESIQLAVERIIKISNEDILKWSNNIKSLPKSVYTYTNENIILKNKIMGIMKR